MTQQKALINLIAAWDALPRGAYSPHEIERWLKNPMWHAVNDAREALGLPRSDGGSTHTSPVDGAAS